MSQVMEAGTTNLDEIVRILPSIHDRHAPNSDSYQSMKQVARQDVDRAFADKQQAHISLGPLGKIQFPYVKMGNVDSRNLFDLDELIMFSFYWVNRHRYSTVADVGANIGLHSILLDRCGYRGCCYEPDPAHFELLKSNLAANDCSRITAVNMAVSSTAGSEVFVRVLGNTTGSHLQGAKPNPYGELERFPVNLAPIAEVISGVDLIKIDAEGHEREILLATESQHWQKTDAIVEIGSAENAAAIYDHFLKMPVNLFAQGSNWNVVRSPSEMPTSYKDGSLFLSCGDAMPW